jgi:DNA-binding NtrC family response regulator
LAGQCRELENYIERAIVLSNGRPLTPRLLALPKRGDRRLRPSGTRLDDVLNLVQQLVRIGIQSLPAEDGRLYERLVGGVERELIEQVMQICDNIQIKAATRLGINRNTLHKKLMELAPDMLADKGRSNAG